MALAQLAIHGGPKTIPDNGQAHVVWPRITPEAEAAVMKQLHETVSIYNRSGIFEEFEDAFSKYHDVKHALLSNSGTSAIFSMFEGINLQPGDEVLCPVYTFHATVSPIIYTGARPVFCDSDEQGNISIDAVHNKISDRTRAVIVTHMWGTPMKNIGKLASLCKEKGIYLLEDCSHAHGASIDHKIVGSFGDAAAWSLQGQKVLTGGEGGIMTTNDAGLFNRAVLQGHYNKRAKVEIPESAPEHAYFLTGLGLKLRAHPLAIALANQQFQHLDGFISQKQTYAEKYHSAFSKYPFLKNPDVNAEAQRNSWYAYIIQYDESEAFGVSREDFVDALLKEGLTEVDIPGSTGLLNELPLFTQASKIMPRLYKEDRPVQGPFPQASKFNDSIIKLPVWAFSDEEALADLYIKGVVKVCDYMMQNEGLSE